MGNRVALGGHCRICGLGAVCLVLAACSGGSGSSGNGSTTTGSAAVALRWNAPNQNMDGSCLGSVAGYHVYSGTSSSNMVLAETLAPSAVSCNASGTSNSCGSIQACTYTLPNVSAGTWYIAVQAFNSSGQNSSDSNVAVKTIP